MFPNPAKTFINVYINDLIGAGTIEVTDLYSKQVKAQPSSIGNNVVNLTSLSKGFYMISLITTEGKSIKKFVLE
jgi:hypothetical protein